MGSAAEAPTVRVHFSDYFLVSPEVVEEYGAFNVSLVNDLPLFIDPFLLFNSDKPEYRLLHDEIIRYVRFLRDKAVAGQVGVGELLAWFVFPEVKQSWLGFSKAGNSGSGLRLDFARSLAANLNTIFRDFGDTAVTKTNHLEKLTLVDSGIGKDRISDFTTNIVKGYLLEYTANFALKNIKPELRKEFTIPKARFNYQTGSWMSGRFILPHNEIDGDYVLLIPKDLLTKDEIWINRADLYGQFDDIVNSVGNAALRAQINNYFLQALPEDATGKERDKAIAKVVRDFPALLEYYIRFKEDHGDQARATSDARVAQSQSLFVRQVNELVGLLQWTGFYQVPGNTYDEAKARVLFLKDVIENKGGHHIFYTGGVPIRQESDLQILYRLTWYATPSDVTREANDGRGPADFKVSRGAQDKTIVEFKLASNKKLRDNLAKQAEIYQRASDAKSVLKVILYFTQAEYERVQRVLRGLELDQSPHIVLIDARNDNKPSASKA